MICLFDPTEDDSPKVMKNMERVKKLQILEKYHYRST